MAKITIRHDPEGNSFDIWFGEPSEIFESEEVEDGLILKKNKVGETIGIEKLNWLPIETWKIGEPVEIDTGVPLTEAQQRVREISESSDREMAYSSAFFIALLNGQLGDVVDKYFSNGRRAEKIEVDVADIIVCSLAYLNWLGKDASEAFTQALDKHVLKLAELSRNPRISPHLARALIRLEEHAARVTPERFSEAFKRFEEAILPME